MSSRCTSAYVLATLTAAAVAALPTLAGPSEGPALEIAKATVDCGGGTQVGGVFELEGTIGQPDAHATLAGAVYEVSGGFWAVSGGNTCPWDCADGNGIVGINDFLAVLSQWALVDTSCDFNGGGVGINDFLDVLANWGPCP